MSVFFDPRFDDLYRRHPLTLADIGARGGLKKNWLAVRRHLRVLGFEPDKREFDQLVSLSRAEGHSDRFFDVALHNRSGSFALHVARERGLSSIFEPDREFLDSFPCADRFDIVDRAVVEADTLDNVLEAHRVHDLDFIKADTQGSELLVLEGASRALAASVVGVEVELEFTPIYRSQPVFSDVDPFLRGLGFFLFDLRPCYWKRAAGRALGGPHGQIIWADALYLKSLRALQTGIAQVESEQKKSKVLKAMTISLLYGYADYVLEIWRGTADLWTVEESAAIEQQLRARQVRQGWLPKLPGRRALATALHRLWKRCREPNDGWSISDPDLGNVD